MLDFTSLNWLAILVATIVHMVLGAIWFGVFAKPWAPLAHPGKTQEQIQAGPKWIYGIAAIGGLITAIILAATLASTNTTGLIDSLSVGLLLWTGFTLVKYATTYAFSWRPTMLLALDVGYPLASILLQAAVLGLWP